MNGLKGIIKQPSLQAGTGISGLSDLTTNQPSLAHPGGIGDEHLPSLTRAAHPADHNLLGNSISARLRKSLSGEATRRRAWRVGSNEAWRRSSNGEVRLPQAEGAIDPDVFEKIRQQQQERKHSEWSRKKQEKLQTRLMCWAVESGRLYSDDDHHGGGEFISFDRHSEKSTERVSMDKHKSNGDYYPRAHGNSVVSYSSGLGSDSVRVMKKDGVFRPVNKYGQSRRKGAADIPFSDTIVDYETVTLPVKEPSKDDDSDHARGRKTVSWSAQGQNEDTQEEKPKESASKASSAKSFRSEPTSWKRPQFASRKSRVEMVGIKWKLPLPKRQKPKPLTRPKQSSVCKDLTPVTSGLDREGTSSEKTRWQVKSHSSPGSGHDDSSLSDVHKSLRTLRHLNLNLSSLVSSPRKVTFSEKTIDSVSCQT